MHTILYWPKSNKSGKSGREDALAPMRSAARLRPGDARLLSDLGMLLADTMRYDEARECYRRALELAPDDPDTTQRLGLLVDHLGDAAQGEALLLRAMALAPGDDHVHYNLGLHRLKHGRFAEGWEGYERRRNFDSFIGRFRDLPLPEWDGAPLDGRSVLVRLTGPSGVIHQVQNSTSLDFCGTLPPGQYEMKSESMAGAGGWSNHDFTLSFAYPGDVNGDSAVNIVDLLGVVSAWGACANPQNCPADVTCDNAVNIADLLDVVSNWG